MKIEVPISLSSEGIIPEIKKLQPEYFKQGYFSDELVVICDFREPQKPYNLLGISFIITDLESLEPFRQGRLEVKETYNLGNREIKYSKIRAPKKREKYVNAFLNVADDIKGLMCNFIIDDSLDQLISNYHSKFCKRYPEYEVYKPKVFRKLDFFSQLISIVLAPLMINVRSIKFVGDEDNLFANERIRELSLLYLMNSIEAYSNYSNNNFNLVFLDPKQDSDDRYLRDLSSIPDLAIGCLTDLFNSFEKNYSFLEQKNQIFGKSVKEKAMSYSEWLFVSHKPLKRVSYFMKLDKINDIILTAPLNAYDEDPSH